MRSGRLAWEYRKPMGIVANRLRGHVVDSSRALFRLAPGLRSRAAGPVQRLTSTPTFTVKGRAEKKDSTIQFTCCVCQRTIEKTDPDGHSLQVRKFGAASPETLWAHGTCLRNAIPALSEGTNVLLK
jgi:hypothetical protein